MSVVIAIKDKLNQRIVIGCDSQATCGQIKNKLPKSSSKIFRLYDFNDLIIGGVGRLRDVQLVQCSQDIISKSNYYENTINYEYVVNNVFKNIYQTLSNQNRITRDTHGNLENTIENEFILAVKDNAFLIDTDGSVLEIEDYLVIGSGEEIAIGVLEQNKLKKPETRIKEAIKACAEKTIYVDNNIEILTTKEQKV